MARVGGGVYRDYSWNSWNRSAGRYGPGRSLVRARERAMHATNTEQRWGLRSER